MKHICFERLRSIYTSTSRTDTNGLPQIYQTLNAKLLRTLLIPISSEHRVTNYSSSANSCTTSQSLRE